MKRVIYVEDTLITLTCSEIHRHLETGWTSTGIVTRSVCTQILVGTEVGSSAGTFIDICTNMQMKVLLTSQITPFTRSSGARIVPESEAT